MIIPPPPPKPISTFDIECYVNYFLVKFYNLYSKTFTSFEMYDGQPLDRAGIVQMLNGRTIVGFNSANYDMPMLFYALSGATCEQLKRLTNAIIQPNNRGLKPWQCEREFGFKIGRNVDHIDLIEVKPGEGSLKLCGAKMHSRKIQDLPFPHDAVLTRPQMIAIEDYCGNDLLVTADMYWKFKPQLDTRVDLTAQYGVDMRSKSDAQIAETAFKQLMGLDYKQCDEIKRKAWLAPGTQFCYKAPEFIKFATPEMQELLRFVERSPFTIQNSGRPLAAEALTDRIFKLGYGSYQITSGGLHSQEKSKSHRADSIYTLTDIDAESFYPKLISILKLYPEGLGKVFLTIFDGWIEVRVEYKRKGEKKKSDTYKIKLNGTYGKTGSQHSIIYSPKMMIQVTLTGQLSLLMLIEMLMQAGIDVVSANTDGIVVKCRRDMHHIRDAVIERWRNLTGFKTEANEYLALFSRDVNAYIAFKPDGSVKTKGAFAPPEPVASSWPNPHAEICTQAVIEFIKNGTPLIKTIRACTDIRQFVSAQAVAGGARWTADGSYIGKTARWYYGRGQTGYLEYVTNGNKVAKTQGAKPCMELPDVLPPDIDYDWYLREAREILVDINCC